MVKKHDSEKSFEEITDEIINSSPTAGVAEMKRVATKNRARAARRHQRAQIRQSEDKRRVRNGRRLLGVAAASLLPIAAHVALNSGNTSGEGNKSSSNPTAEPAESISTVEAGFNFTFEEGETPDSKAMTVAGIDPDHLDEASSAQREIYVRTRDAIVSELGAKGIEATNIPIDYELRMPQDPNVD